MCLLYNEMYENNFADRYQLSGLVIIKWEKNVERYSNILLIEIVSCDNASAFNILIDMNRTIF